MAQFPSQSSASGLWSLKKQKRAAQGGNWPGINDPYFEYVSLLLPGNGTNGAQNNTFLDGSTNNFTITRNGGTTQGTFTPYGSNWSNYLDGTGDSIQTVSSSLWTWTTATSWTIEAFVFPLTRASVQPIYGAFAGSPGSGTNNGELLIETTGQVTFRYWNGAEQKVTTSGTVPLNTWSHVVMAFDGTNIAIYISGTRSANTARSGTPDSSTNVLYLGTTRFGTSGDTQLYFTGYISNARVVRNSVVYSGATISVPTAPLTVVTGTQLLTCADNRFIDDSTNNFTITRNGDVSVQRFSPFNPTAPYAAGTIGGSGYFDGNGDYLTAPNNAAFTFGTGDFRISLWVYSNDLSGSRSLVDMRDGSTGALGIALYINSGELRFYTGGADRILGATLTVGQWFFIELSRVSNTTRMFVNGAQTGASYTDTNNYISNAPRIGVFSDGLTTGFFNGYISDLRLVKGSGITVSALPTAPLTAITNTSLLLNYTNAGIIDNAMLNDLETVGNAQISTSVSKFGGGSMAFDGSGDLLYLPANENFNLGTTYTIELWLYMNNPATGGIMFAISDINTGSFAELSLQVSSSAPRFVVRPTTGGAFAAVTGGTLLANTWQHIAISVDAGSGRLFLNGVQVGSTTTFSALQTRVHVGVGGYGNGFGTTLNGYIDDLRITKGYARYTANFTPPGPLPLY